MIRTLLLLFVTIMMSASYMAYAQDAGTSQITRGQLEPSSPVITSKDMVSAAMASALFKQCRSFYPRRFTPNALDSYCKCSVTATQATISAKEYTELQSSKNRVAGNKTFQKYVTSVIAPCMITPTVDIEYLSCVLDRYADNRIASFPQYCQCVAREARNHVEYNGDVDILISMGSNPKIQDPFEALWINSKYMSVVRQARTSCLSSYMKKPTQYTYE